MSESDFYKTHSHQNNHTDSLNEHQNWNSGTITSNNIGFLLHAINISGQCGGLLKKNTKCGSISAITLWQVDVISDILFHESFWHVEEKYITLYVLNLWNSLYNILVVCDGSLCHHAPVWGLCAKQMLRFNLCIFGFC